MPCVARPPANVVACASAMPTSKKRSGHFFWKIPVPVPDGMAAVIATSLGYSPASWVIASPNIVVHWGGPALTGRSSPVTGSRSEEHTSELQSLAYLVCRLLLEKKKK